MLLVDRLASVTMVLMTTVRLVVHRYPLRYMLRGWEPCAIFRFTGFVHVGSVGPRHSSGVMFITDEVVRLLRVLEERCPRRVGGATTIPWTAIHSGHSLQPQNCSARPMVYRAVRHGIEATSPPLVGCSRGDANQYDFWGNSRALMNLIE